LADFNADNGQYLGSGINGYDGVNQTPVLTLMRVENVARVIEHEFLMHGVKGLTDEGVGGLGEVEDQLNHFREQMGVPKRVSYGYFSDEWTCPAFDEHNRPIKPIYRVSVEAVDSNGHSYYIHYDRKAIDVMKYKVPR